MAIKSDFVGDMSWLIRQYTSDLGYSLPLPLSNRAVILRYFNLKHRLISRNKRTVSRANGFYCPPELTAGLKLLEKKIVRGDDLRAHMSKGILAPEYSDALLNDWGVAHFHLGTTIDARGFVERTGPVLFAFFNETHAFLIDIRPHGQWSCYETLKSIHKNWPHLLEPYRVYGVLGTEHGPLTDEELSKMRRAGVMVPHEIEGCLYLSPGGGYATDGTSMVASRNTMDFIRFFRELEEEFQKHFHEKEPAMRLLLAEEGTYLPDPADLRLERAADGRVFATLGWTNRQRHIANLTIY